MTPAAILAEAVADGLTVTVSPSGGLRVRGDPEAVERWQPALLGAKAGLLALLRNPPATAPSTRTADDRRTCTECRNFTAPTTCGAWRKTGRTSPRLPADLAAVPQRCAGFEAAGGGAHAAELRRLVRLAGEHYAFSEIEHVEALAEAMADPEAALRHYRMVEARLLELLGRHGAATIH